MKQDWTKLYNAKTTGEALKGIAENVLSPDDPERIYIEWMVRNTSDLKGAVSRLGLAVEEGPNFADRLKAAVLPELIRRR